MMIKDIRICFVGDSFVNGTGDKQKLGWSGRLCALLEAKNIEITYYNLGIRRNTSSDIKARWEQECSCRLPQGSENLVVFSYGVNDTVIENGKQRVSSEQSIENTKQILIEASKIYSVIMIGPPPIEGEQQNTRIKELDSSFNLLCKESSTPYLSIFEELKINKAWHEEVSSNDGAHPREKGYSILANLVKSWEYWDLN